MSNPHEVKTVRCANCKKQKEQANHWFVVEMSHYFLAVPLPAHTLAEWEFPACGRACAQKLFEQWMTSTRNAANEAAETNQAKAE